MMYTCFVRNTDLENVLFLRFASLELWGIDACHIAGTDMCWNYCAISKW